MILQLDICSSASKFVSYKQMNSETMIHEFGPEIGSFVD